MFDIKEIVHSYKGYGRYPSKCLVRTFDGEEGTYVCFIDIDLGTSVTNASEQLATEMVEKFSLNPLTTRFFETYAINEYDTFDEITYNWHETNKRWNETGNMWIAANPKWSPDVSEFKNIFLKRTEE